MSTKTDFLRGLTLFNPKIYVPATPSNKDRITGKIADYEASDGGRWNYDDFYQVVRHVLKGASFEQAMTHLGTLEGSGEAAAKTSLLKFVDKHLNLADSEYVDCGPREIRVDDRTAIRIAPDFACKLDGVIRHVLVYPNRQPALSEAQRDVVKSLMSQPFSGGEETYNFCMIEFPGIEGKRVGRYEEIPFAYGSISQEFLMHMSDFYSELSNKRGGQGTLI
ncbi:hypothetical protein [Pseudophaeobacter sp.]|uniref:hypothetical protein n=1 Tax=Pseudophaeobacter sp. TaxID=1971739 RepID=UPI0026234343|nr:hypothetical protein [Pseudophaeobacter sp.]